MVLDDHELKEIRSLARAEQMSVSEWVRQTRRAARKQKPTGRSSRKIRVIRTAAEHTFPTADIAQMIAQIESGYGAP